MNLKYKTIYNLKMQRRYSCSRQILEKYNFVFISLINPVICTVIELKQQLCNKMQFNISEINNL